VTDKTDTAPDARRSGPTGPQGWQAVLAAGLAVFTAASVALVTRVGDAASADTYVTSATQAVIGLADGSEKPATIGALLPRGAQLRTGRTGGARLTTAGRDVYVGALSTVHVLDGVRQRLDKGLVMVDSRSGPELRLATEAGSVMTRHGALARVEQNVATLRLAVYDGSAAITAADRHATTAVPALHQIRIPYGGLPSPTTALALTIRGNGSYDTWEQRLAANLVQADIDLNGFASGLNGSDGVAVLRTAPASLSTALMPGRTRGEQALALAVAQKATLKRALADNLAVVQHDRSDGGSWGVVAAIVKAPVSAVTSVLGATLDEPGGPFPTAVAGGPFPLPGLTSSPGTTTGPSSRPTSRPHTTPPTTPAPPVTSTPPSLVDQVVATVLHLLPTPPAQPTKPVVPVPTSPPLLQLNPLKVG
jgi:hypothetical protein